MGITTTHARNEINTHSHRHTNKQTQLRNETSEDAHLKYIHARSRDELRQVFAAICDQSTAFPKSFLARFFIRVSLSSDVEHFERPSGTGRARLANLNVPAKPSRPEHCFRSGQRSRAGPSGHFEHRAESSAQFRAPLRF